MLSEVKTRVYSWLTKHTPAAPGLDNKTYGLWIDLPDSQKINQQSQVSPEIKTLTSEFIEQGVVVVKNSISPELCDLAISFYKSYAKDLLIGSPFEEIAHPSKTPYPRMVNLHGISPVFKKLFSQNKTRQLADYAFGSPASVYTSLTFEVGTQQPIHRDIPVFRTSPDARYFGMWVALEDADENNGPLMVIRGGHAQQFVDPYEFAEKHLPRLKSHSNEDLQRDLWIPYQDAVTNACLNAGLKVEKVTVNKGDTVLWHSLLPHGGSPILSPGRSRHSCVFHIVPGKTPVYQADVFFKRKHFAPPRWPRKYEDFEGCLFLKNPPPSFMA